MVLVPPCPWAASFFIRKSAGASTRFGCGSSAGDPSRQRRVEETNPAILSLAGCCKTSEIERYSILEPPVLYIADRSAPFNACDHAALASSFGMRIRLEAT